MEVRVEDLEVGVLGLKVRFGSPVHGVEDLEVRVLGLRIWRLGFWG